VTDLEEIIEEGSRMYGLVPPRQGAQRPRMDADLFRRYLEIAAAENVLGWSPPELAERGGVAQLSNTRYGRPAVFLVKALRALASRDEVA
jgi:[acyl-carrier-protein] S-malonyltransferase